MGVFFSHHEEFGPKTADFRVNIRYCGSWGYYTYAAVAEDLLTNEFGDKLHIVSDKDRWVTGNLDLTITNNKTGETEVIHSKSRGDGFITKANKNSIVSKIEQFMEK